MFFCIGDTNVPLRLKPVLPLGAAHITIFNFFLSFAKNLKMCQKKQFYFFERKPRKFAKLRACTLDDFLCESGKKYFNAKK